MLQTKDVEKIITHILCSVTLFVSKILRFMRKSEKKKVEPDGPHITIRRMRTARCIPKATNTHSEYVPLIAFPLQQWLLERASMFSFRLDDGY